MQTPRGGLLKWPVFVIFVAAVLVWRRPDQFLHPYVWVEEGTVTLPAYLAHGWWSIFDPVAGYIVLPAKVIFLTAASLSFTHLPRIAYWLTILFEVGTLALIAYSPSRLRLPMLCALFVALVPTDSEIFAVSEYAFWWGSLWSFVAIFWDERKNPPRTMWRCVLAILGGLSSPMALPVAAIFACRAAVLRRRADVVVLTAAALAALIQWNAMHSTGFMSAEPMGGLPPVAVVTRYFGDFGLAWAPLPEHSVTLAGFIVLLGGVTYTLAYRKWRDPWFMMLMALLLASVLASAIRMSPSITHPFFAGPRYYFYPYICLGWALIYMLPEVDALGRVAVGLLLAGVLVQVGLHGQRRHDRISWRGELQHCSASVATKYPLPVHFDGAIAHVWHVSLTSEQCETLKERSLFR